jgi:hypothetical protein
LPVGVSSGEKQRTRDDPSINSHGAMVAQGGL